MITPTDATFFVVDGYYRWCYSPHGDCDVPTGASLITREEYVNYVESFVFDTAPIIAEWEARRDAGYLVRIAALRAACMPNATIAALAPELAPLLDSNEPPCSGTPGGEGGGTPPVQQWTEATWPGVRVRDEGEYVRRIQAKLNSPAFLFPVPATGVYDNDTKQAVRDLQARDGLTVRNYVDWPTAVHLGIVNWPGD